MTHFLNQAEQAENQPACVKCGTREDVKYGLCASCLKSEETAFERNKLIEQNHIRYEKLMNRQLIQGDLKLCSFENAKPVPAVNQEVWDWCKQVKALEASAWTVV